MSYHKDNIYDLTIIKGKRIGVYKTYYDTQGSKIWTMGGFKDDKPVGRWTSLTEDGKVECEKIYFSDFDKVSPHRLRDMEKGFVEKLTYYFSNGKIIEFNIPYDDKEYYQDDCNKYWFRLMTEKRRIDNGREQLWEDNKWNIHRCMKGEYNQTEEPIKDGEIILIKKGRD